MRVAALLLLMVGSSWGCSRHSLEVRARLMPEGYIRYEGTLAGPYEKFEAMADAACESMSKPSDSGEGGYALGYCALYFYSPEDHGFFLSHIARLEGEAWGVERSCAIPRDLLRPEQKHVVSLGGVHEPSQAENPKAAPVWRPTHFMDLETREAWDQDTLVFSLEEPGTCMSYDYGYFQGVVAVRRSDKWFAIGEVDREGSIQALAVE